MALAEKPLPAGSVVITGASAGVGRATAHRFARAGARLGLIARDGEALGQVQAEVERLGGRALALAADVADADAIFAAAEQVERRLGPIAIWINNAMVTVFAPVSAVTAEEVRRVTEVTYLGYVHGTMAALKHMRPRRRGAIVQVGSSLAYRGIPLQAAYCGAKHAIRGFTDSLRAELLHEGDPIALTMVQLPAVNTPQFDWARSHLPHAPRPVAPVLQPEAAAEAIYTAALRPRREYWLGGGTAKVILGSSLLPGFVDRYLARRGYRAQQGARPLGPRRDNLFHPQTDLHRTRGLFGRGAKSHMLLLSEEQVRKGALVLGFGLAAAAGFLLGRRR